MTKQKNQKLAFYTPPFPRIKTCFDMIDISADYGLFGVEFFPLAELGTPDKEAAKRIREYADCKNIRIPCFSLFINLADTAPSDALVRLRAYAEIAQILGASYLHHTIVGEFQNPHAVLPYKKELMATGISVVREIYDYANTLGIRTVYEDQGYIFNGVENFGEFLATVDRNVGVVADFGNIYQSTDTPEAFLGAFASKVVHVHLKDVILTKTNESGQGVPSLSGNFMNAAQIGKGSIDFEKCISLLKNANYDGYYSLEYAALADDSPAIDEVLAYMRQLLSEA